MMTIASHEVALFDRFDREDIRLDAISVLKESIRKNIEHILNTTHLYHGVDTDDIQRQPLLSYGIPTLNHLSLNYESEHYICHVIQQQIDLFEPRLDDTEVELAKNHKVRILTMHISGKLLIADQAIYCQFLSVYQHSKHNFLLRESQLS